MGSLSNSSSTPINNYNNQEKIMSTLSIIISRLDRMVDHEKEENFLVKSRLDRIEKILFDLVDYLKTDKFTNHHHHQPSSDLIEIETNQPIDNDNLKQQQQIDLSSNSVSVPDEEEYFVCAVYNESNDESSKQNCSTRITTNNVDDNDVDECLLDRNQRKGDKRYNCDQCDYATSYKSALKRHIRIHTGDKPYKCKQCEYSTAQHCNLQKHIRIHSGEKPFKCNQCQYATTDKSAFQKHIRIHTGEKPFKCEHCEYKTSDKYALQKHIRIHTGEKPFKCNQCEFVTTQQNSLQRHKRLIHSSCNMLQKMGSLSNSSSTPINNYNNQEKIMSTLSIIISRLDRMADHEKEENFLVKSRLDRIEKILFDLVDYLKTDKFTNHHHHQPSSNSIEIETNQPINNNDNLRQQQQIDLSTNGVSLPNNEIEQYSLLPDENNDYLEIKIETNDNNDNVVDDNSVENVDNECSIDRHKRIPNKRHKCDQCQYSTTDKSNLKKHVRIHSGDKRYKCKQCEYATSDKSALQRHILIHTGEKPYKCNQCKYASSDKSGLRKHIRIHSDYKPYKCNHCQYATINNSDLKRHVRRKHS
uniref:Zinc finger protein 808-like n=1 Tax=Dermatophagoides pteronyssinus TaxID=6956 RepID=A0A6P6YIU2_DERPT|nr:zinc finger protein 808-like [Dermatophagoides pteronyssinus]